MTQTPEQEANNQEKKPDKLLPFFKNFLLAQVFTLLSGIGVYALGTWAGDKNVVMHTAVSTGLAEALGILIAFPD